MSKKDLSFKRTMMMVNSLVKATTKYVKSGYKTRTETEQAEVINICRSCDSYTLSLSFIPRCGKCGCCLHIKKRWITADCPIGKW